MDSWYFKHYADDSLDQIWFGLICFYVLVTLWKSFLCLRTIIRMRKMVATPVLFEGKMDYITFEKLKNQTKIEAYDELLDAFADLGVRVFQLTSKYYPYVWSLTTDFSKSAFYRAVWFSAIDNILYESTFIPVNFINALYHKRDPFLAVLNGLYEALYSAGMTGIRAFVMVYMFELVHPSGIAILMVLYDIIEMVLLAMFMKFLEDHILKPLPKNDVGAMVEFMAVGVGYPVSMIYVDDMSPEPEAIYYTALWYNMVTVTPKLMSVLDPEEVAAMVAHELGKWYYFQNLYHHACHFVGLIIKCYFLVATYGNQRIRKTFRMDPNAHDVISHHLAFHFFWEPSYEVADGIYNFIKAFGYFVRDDYACDVWLTISLKEALIKLSSWNDLYFSLHDPWQAKWFYGSPTSIQRIARLQGEERSFRSIISPPRYMRPPRGENMG